MALYTRKTRLKQETPWEGVPESMDAYFGFVYLIENRLTQQKYIGRKYLWKAVRKKLPGKKRAVKSVIESDWKFYTGSCAPLNADIKKLGIAAFRFTIMQFCGTRASTNYHEVKEQFVRDVLHSKLPNGKFEYYNTNIMSRYFRGNIEKHT